MNIFIICAKLDEGGAERVATILANGLSKRHNVSIISNRQNSKYEYSLLPSVNFFQLSNTKNKLQGWNNAIHNVRKYIDREHPDIIIGIMGLCSLIAKISCIGKNIPIVMTEHFAFERPLSYPFTLKNKFFKFYLNKLYNHITVLTEADKNVIKNRFRNVYVMPNPLPLKTCDKLPEKEKIIFAVGRIDGWYVKGFDVLLHAWSKIETHLNSPCLGRTSNQTGANNNHKWWLKIAGTGKKESFKYLMNLLPDGNWRLNDNVNSNDNWLWKSEKYHVEFLGFRKDMEELYKKAEIFVLSSRCEGFGLALIEAMSQGCACVACDYKGRQREILNPSPSLPEGEGKLNDKIYITENGILCEPENVEALAKGMDKMISDDKLRMEIQKNGIERSEFYSIDNTIKRWDNLIQKVVNKA